MNHDDMGDVWVTVAMNDKAHPRWGLDPGGPLVHEVYVRKASKDDAMKRAAALERNGHGACRIARIVFEDEAGPVDQQTATKEQQV